jgi:hypothetical protein
MCDQTFINNIVSYLGGPDSNSNINAARILLLTGYPNFNVAGWESPTGGGKFYGAMIDAVAASILTGQVMGYTDATPSNPSAGSSSTTGLMMGLAVTYTPTRSGIVKVHVRGGMTNSTAGDGAAAKLYYGTAPAPPNGNNPTGTQKGAVSQIDYFPTASKYFPFGIDTVIPGLTLGTQYWFDLALLAVTGGTASVNNLEVVITEL